jgi:hypothetical protein
MALRTRITIPLLGIQVFWLLFNGPGFSENARASPVETQQMLGQTLASQRDQPTSSGTSYVLLPNPSEELGTELVPPTVSVLLSSDKGSSPSYLEQWGFNHWLGELTPEGGGRSIWLSVEKSRFEPESLVSGLPVKLVRIGEHRTAMWNGESLSWSEFPFRFDISFANELEGIRVAKSFRLIKGVPRLAKISGYQTDGLLTVASLRQGIRVRSIVTFDRSSPGLGKVAGLSEVILEGEPRKLGRYARALSAFPSYPFNFEGGPRFRSGQSWVGGRSIGHWKMWFEEPGVLVFLNESKYSFEDVSKWVRLPIDTLNKSISVEDSAKPLEIPIDVWSFAERSTIDSANENPKPDVWLNSPKLSDFPVLLVGGSGRNRWEIRRDLDGGLMSRTGGNVSAIDGFAVVVDGKLTFQEGWLFLGNAFAYVQTVDTGSGPWELRVNEKPPKRVYPKRLRNGSLLVIVFGLTQPFPATPPDVEIVSANA